MTLTRAQRAARTLGRLTSPRKAAAARANGRLGGHPCPAGVSQRQLLRELREARAQVHLARPSHEIYYPAAWAGYRDAGRATTSQPVQWGLGRADTQALAYAAAAVARAHGIHDYWPDPEHVTTHRGHVRAIQAELLALARAEAHADETCGDYDPQRDVPHD